jgi:hypothetical protein
MLLHNFLRDVDASDQAQDLSQNPRRTTAESNWQTQDRDEEEAPENSDAQRGDVDDGDLIQFDFSNGTAWRAWMSQAMWDEYKEFQQAPDEISSGESDYATSDDDQEDE